MKFVKDLFSSKYMWIGLGVGVVLALGFSRIIPAILKKGVAKIPGAQVPPAA